MTTTRRLTTGAARKLPTIGVDQPQHINKQHMGKQSSPVFPADYVYVTKLWPLTVSKSLFSECIAYEKLKLKVSLAYLGQPGKEPLVARVHYGPTLLATYAEQQSRACDGRIGMVKCLLTQQCVKGNL